VTIHTETPRTSWSEPIPEDTVADPVFAKVKSVLSVATLILMMVWVTVKASQLSNPDTWFHLSLGHEFNAGWSLSDPGRLSKFATSPWLPTQWSTEVLAARVEDWVGLPGVAWLFGAFILVFLLAVFFLCRREGELLAAAVATSFTVIAAYPSLSARPQVVSLILFAVTVGAWRSAVRKRIPPWWLIPLTWVWATAHGLWTAGVLVGVATCVGMVLDRQVTRRNAMTFLAVPALSVLAACLTPVGPRLLTTQFAVGARTPLIEEWGPTSFRSMPALAAALMVAAVVVLWSRGDRMRWTPLLHLLLAGGWILLVTRMVGFGAVLVAPLFVAAVSEVVTQRGDRRSRGERAGVWGGVLACLIGLALAVPQSASAPDQVPARFAPRLEALPDGAAVLVEDGTGAWIEYAFPSLNPSIDGMLDAYPVDYIEAFNGFRELEPGWTDFVRRSGAEVAVLEQGSPVAAAFEDQLGWTMLQRDSAWVYLSAPTVEPK